jgi:Flp pilus assembly pilin Flp
MLQVFLDEELGATIVEHGLIALGLSLAIVAASGIVGAALYHLAGAAPLGRNG